MPTHYDLLGVSPHASQDEIRRAYHRMARRHHPDANPGRTQGGPPPGARRGEATTMAEINAAWAVLGNPQKRRAYDLTIGTPPSAGPAEAPDGFDGSYGGDYDDLRHLYDDLIVPRRPRPSDMLIMIPVVLAVAAIALFAFSLMSESEGMRTTALLLVPVTAASFVAAPLVTMLRARGRNEDSRSS